MRFGIFFLCLFSISLSSVAQDFKYLFDLPSKQEILKEPSSAAINSKKEIFISDPDHKAVLKFDQKGSLVETIKTLTVDKKSYELKNPIDLFVSNKDHLYILDRGHESVFIIQDDKTVHKVGSADSDLGFISGAQSLTVDSKGNIYVLSSYENRVEVFSANGHFITWINASADRNFQDPVAIGMSSEDLLYVLELESATVHMFDHFFNPVKTLPNLAKAKGANIQKPADLVVLDNSDFLILDKKTSQIAHFNSDGQILSKFGSQGKYSKGVFEWANSVSRNPSLPNHLIITDNDAAKAQIYDISFQFKLNPSKRDSINISIPKTPSFGPFKSIFISAKNRYYVVPKDPSDKVLVYNSPYQKAIQTLRVSEPIAIATDQKNNAFVLDADEQEVIMFDPEGVQIRKFGQEIKEKLRDASGLATLSDGSILVSDLDNGNIKKWNNQGIFQGVFIAKKVGHLEEPAQIVVDSKDNIYIWDKKLNAIYKYSSSGHKLNADKITLRTTQHKENNAKIAAIAIDVLNQLYVFNETTSQIEVFEWKQKPVCIFRYGRPGRGKDGFEDVYAFGLNPKSFGIYASQYGKTPIKTARLPFVDYIGIGNDLFEKKEYDNAWHVYTTGYEKMGQPKTLRNHIINQYNLAGKELCSRYELDRGLLNYERALSLDKRHPSTLSGLCFGYEMSISKAALQEDFETLVKTSESMMQKFTQIIPGALSRVQTVKPVLEAIDSVASEFMTSKKEKKLQAAVQLFNRLTTWDKNNPKYLFGLAKSNWAYYHFRKSIGAPGFELDVQLKKAETNARSAYELLKKAQPSSKNPFFHDVELFYIDILNESRDYKKSISVCVEALVNPELNDSTALNYRHRLANAYLGVNNYKSAILEYQRILGIKPQSREVKMQLANVLIKDRRFDDAKRIYQGLLIDKQNDAYLIGKLGEIELLKKNYAEASFQLEKALKINPEQRSFYGPLAEAYDGGSKYKKAIENYRLAIQQLEHELNYLRNRNSGGQEISLLQLKIGNYLSSMGRIYMNIGQYDHAIKALTDVTSINPSQADAWYNLGMAYMKTGLTYKALDAFTTAQKFDPKSKKIVRAIANAEKLKTLSERNRPTVEIVKAKILDIFPSLYKNYADVSVQPIGEVVLANNTLLPINGVNLTFYVKDLMAAPSSQPISALVGYSNTTIKLSAIFDKKILENTEDKTLQASIMLTYTYNGVEKSVGKNIPFTLRNRNSLSWSDKRWLAAFVDPSTPELINYVKRLDVLFQDAGKHGKLETLIKAGRIYTSLHKNAFTYSPDPQLSFSDATTKDVLDFLQYPAETLVRKSGDCDDLVALYCGLLESAGIATAYVDVPGHVFMAFDSGLKPEELLAIGIQTKDVVIMYGKVWIPIEATLIATGDFLESWQNASERYYGELDQGNFPELVPLSDARRIYTASTYVPKSFEIAMPDASVLKNESGWLITELNGLATRAIIKQLEERRKQEPENIYVRTKLAKLYAKHKKPKLAIDVCNEAISIYPESASLYKLLGSIYFSDNNHQNALTAFSNSLKFNNEDSVVYIKKCQSELALGDKENAKKSFEKAMELNPKLIENYGDLKTQF